VETVGALVVTTSLLSSNDVVIESANVVSE
jgi:hypothetical protein